MATTLAEAIKQTRDIIQDAREPLRHSDDKLVGYVNDAMLDAWRLRADLFLVTGTKASSWVAPVEMTIADIELGTQLPISPQYFTATVDYVSGMIGLGDDEFAVEGRAVTLLNRYSQKLVGKGA